jgi:deoxyinosine 3'endonuclease (endonuclease V)
VAGLDVSYSKTSEKRGVAALVVCEYPSMKVLYEDFLLEIADCPYIPGFLAFKEVPAYLELFERLKSKAPHLWP